MSMRESSKKAAKTTGAWLFLAPSLLGVLVFVMIPFGDALRRSFFDSRGIDFVGLGVYRGVLANQAFRLAAVNTVRFMGTALPLLMAVSFFLSLLVYQYSRKKSFFKTVLVLPVAVPAASVVLLWRMVFCEQGIINELFGLQTDWIYGPASFSVLIFAYLWKNTGYQMLLWLAALGGISDELYEAAEVDGAGWLQKLLYITIPQVRKAAGMILFLAVINSFKVFREAYLISGDYPHESIYMMQHLFNNWFVSLDIQKMSAASVMIESSVLIPVIIWIRRRNKK